MRALLFLLAPLLLSTSVLSQVKPVRRVLVFYELGLSSPGVSAADEELRAILEASPYQIELYREYLETTLFPAPAEQQEIRDWYVHKYRDHRPDVIIAMGPSPLKFIAEAHEKYFKDIPIVFGGAEEHLADNPQLDSHLTGVWERPEPEKTLQAALRLLPATRHVVVVGGTSSYDRHIEEIFKAHLRSYEGTFDFTYLTDLATPALLERLKHLPEHTIVIYTSLSRDARGTLYIAASQVGPMIVKAADAPVFSAADVELGHGEVGGYVDSFATEGKTVGTIVVRILNGEKPQNIPIVGGANAYIFDWNALRRWSLKEADLPPGSMVLNRPPTFWVAYRRYVVGGIVLLLSQTAIIGALLWQRARRIKAQKALARSNSRLRLAMKAAKAVGWHSDLKRGRTVWFGDLQGLFGIPGDEFSAAAGEFLQYVHPEDRSRVSETVSHAKNDHEPFVTELRVAAPGGVTRWTACGGRFEYESDGRPTSMMGMAVDITARKLTEEALQKSEEKFSKAFRESPLVVTLSSAKDDRYLEVNDTFERASGWPRHEVIGRTPVELGIVDLEERSRFRDRLFAAGSIRNYEIRVRTKDGEQRLGLVSGELIEVNSDQCILSVGADITEVKQAENKLRESEERFRLVANTAPVMIWMSGPDKLCNYVNRPWLEFTGRSLEAELGNGWAECVHSEDMERCLQTYFHAFDRGEPFEMEYRLRRYDGEYRWIFDRGVPRFNSDGSFAGYIGSCIDVTERKLAEEALSTVSRRLIEAHEEERTWVARELHDDVNPRLALLSVGLDIVERELPPSGGEARRRIGKLKAEVRDLGNDIQALSHRLHSSKLEYLGLSAAARGFCREFSERQGVKIEFYSDAIPESLPQETSLCLFRVLQEAVQNASKHSDAPQFEVSLTCTSNRVHLRVHDAGIGFNPQEAINHRGLGITSMRERLKLVGGELAIDSQIQKGTVVHASVPSVRARTAGE